MINEFFYGNIKFVWRQNLCDKTLAVIFGSYCRILKRRSGSSSFFIVFFFISSFFPFKFVVTNKFNFRNFIIFRTLCVDFLRNIWERTLMKQIVRSFYVRDLCLCVYSISNCADQQPETTEIKFNVISLLQLNFQLQTALFHCPPRGVRKKMGKLI